MKVKVGIGYDVHRLEEGEDLWLGGIKIDHTKGATGHSDADVIIHAICDALLGSLSLGDIGQHFPNTDPKYKNIDSKNLLREVMQMVTAKGFQVGNVDVSLSLEKPRVSEHIEKMKTVLSEILHVSMDEISIKATTSEKLGFVGREEGVEAHAVALIYQKS